MTIIKPILKQPTILVESGLRFIADSEITYVIGSYDIDYQVCQLRFRKYQDKYAIDIECPYFPKNIPGILFKTTFQEKPPNNLDIWNGGKATSHLVKYAHYTSGEAHFSQDRKSRTKIRRNAFPLDSCTGQIFSLHLYYTYMFKELKKENVKRKRTYLNSRFSDKLPEAVVITGEWHRKEEIRDNIIQGNTIIGPDIIDRNTNAERRGVLIGMPSNHLLGDFILILRCEPIDILPNLEKPTMIFLGGFDSYSPKPRDIQKPISQEFIGWIYPTYSPDNISDLIGSLDYNPQCRSV